MKFEDMVTREEAHWSSFRSAIAGLQRTLRTQAPSALGDAECDGDDPRVIDKTGYISTDNHDAKRNHKDGNSSRQMNHARTEGEKRQSNRPQKEFNLPKDELGTSNMIMNDSNDTGTEKEANNRLELIGLDEVNTDNDLILSPASAAPSHTSHDTASALSMAEQQLAELRLKLAMTESERDELEFRLMQSS